MMVISAIALFVIHNSVSDSLQVWVLLLTSTVATVLVMSALHAALLQLYNAKSESEQKAKQDARIDSLTGIGNRKHIIEELDQVCAATSEHPRHALLMMDLNGFKRVNDTLGHQYGDDLISAVAHRLSKWLPDSALGRLGGDEFAVIVEAKDEAELSEKCDYVSKVFEEPFRLSGGDCPAAGSIGACLIKSKYQASEILRLADLALYDAKENKRSFRIFDKAMSKLHDRTTRLTEDLQSSLETGEGLFVEYQPIISTSGQIEAMEGFLRWRHHELGLIRPLETIALAEKFQLIGDIDRFVASTVLKAAQEHPDLRLCINVSGLQLLDEHFPTWLGEQAKAHGVPPSQLIIEVSEVAIAERLPQFATAFEVLTKLGCEVAVDNFGRNPTSVAELRRIGVSMVKIDREVLLTAQKQRNISILRARVDLAKTLKMKVTATGVDTEPLEAIAIQAGIEWIQGFNKGIPGKLPAVLKVKNAA